MKSTVRSGTLLLCLLSAASAARADPFVVTTATLSTGGWFDCRGITTCTGEGTDTVTFHNGAESATLSFHGVDSTFEVTNRAESVTVGHFELDASDGFTFPTHPANPVQPILRFYFAYEQTTPVASSKVKVFQFGPGGGTSLPLGLGTAYFTFPIGETGFNYGLIAYTFNPVPRINFGTTALTADVGAVPEPATMVLLGTGLLGAAAARRKRRARS